MSGGDDELPFKLEFTNNPAVDAVVQERFFATRDEAGAAYDTVRETYRRVWFNEIAVRGDNGKQDWVCTHWTEDAWDDQRPLPRSEKLGWALRRDVWVEITYEPLDAAPAATSV